MTSRLLRPFFCLSGLLPALGLMSVLAVVPAGATEFSDDSIQSSLPPASGAVTHRIGANADIALGANRTWRVVGSFTLTKTGSGTLTLTDANTYDGGTTVSDGTPQVSRPKLSTFPSNSSSRL